MSVDEVFVSQLLNLQILFDRETSYMNCSHRTLTAMVTTWLNWHTFNHNLSYPPVISFELTISSC